MFVTKIEPYSLKVAPFVGAWIEIMKINIVKEE